MSTPAILTIFCRVVDNYGDIGVCWRLARSLAQRGVYQLHLWVDDLVSFQTICPEISVNIQQQCINQIVVHHWHDDADFTVAVSSRVLIEAFACELPASLQAALALRWRETGQQAVWLNLEYLSAESWVEDCHALCSVQAQTGLRKYFFFPGFSEKTGGLLYEAEVLASLSDFQQQPQEQQDFLRKLGVVWRPEAQRISLFCYPPAPLLALLGLAQKQNLALQILLAEGVASAQIEQFTGMRLRAGQRWQSGALSIECLPFITQTDYDFLLASCDANLVRGEDSFVRAQLVAKPMLWHIYPQQELAHIEKLTAFMQRYLAGIACSELRTELEQLFLAWNAQAELPESSWDLLLNQPVWTEMAQQWQRKITLNGDLSTRLLQFIEKIG